MSTKYLPLPEAAARLGCSADFIERLEHEGLIDLKRTLDDVVVISADGLERVRFIAALKDAHPLAARKRVALSDLAPEPLVLSPREVTPHQFDRIHAGVHAAGLTPRVGQQARSIVAQLGFVASGLGYALVPVYARKLAIAGVTFVALHESLDSVPLSLIWDERRASSQLAAFRRQVEAAYPRRSGRRLRSAAY